MFMYLRERFMQMNAVTNGVQYIGTLCLIVIYKSKFMLY